MTRENFIKLMDTQVKLIRSEYGLTQDKMSMLLGLSKKTLVEIEKERSSLGWTGSVALASIFSNSSILINALGGNVEDIIVAIAFNDMDVRYPKTWGGKLWWKTILKRGGYMIQQNLVSQHYRLLDPLYRRRLIWMTLKRILERSLKTKRLMQRRHHHEKH